MSIAFDSERVRQQATELLAQGNKVTVSMVADALSIEASDALQEELNRWWMDIESNVPFGALTRTDANRHQVPDTVYQSVQLIWDNALKDARHQLEQSLREQELINKNKSLSSEDELTLVRTQISAVEDSNQRLRSKLLDAESAIKALEAERAMLRTNIQSSGTQISELEHQLTSTQTLAEQTKSSLQDAKGQLDKRIKEEVTRHQETTKQMASKLKYYRNQLDKLRDEWNKKETALNGRIQDYQAQISHNGVVMDAQKRQLRAQDEELQRFRSEVTNQSRSVSSSNTQVLAKNNLIKRLEDELQQREMEVKEVKKRGNIEKADYNRRETDLRNMLTERETELNINTAKLNELQRTLIAREEEVRRLTARL